MLAFESRRIPEQLTDFPQRHSKILVCIELLSKLIAFVQNSHKFEQISRRYRRVDFFILQQLMCSLDQKELQNAFDDDLPEDLLSIWDWLKVEVSLFVNWRIWI